MISREFVAEIYGRPLLELVFDAQTVHRRHHRPSEVQCSTLLSIKTGGCPEDCGYCAQSAWNKTAVDREAMASVDRVVQEATRAKAQGATRFCMGGAWRDLPARELPRVEEMVRQVKALGLETCLTAGMVTNVQAGRLKAAGLDYYNHNLDTSREHYPEVVTTRSYDDRLATLQRVREAGIAVCCGGILGLGERPEDRVGLVWELANLPTPPESVPINALEAIDGTPMAGKGAALDPLEIVRTIATARIVLPKTVIRLSAGRRSMSDEMQALCFLAGANSIFLGEKLLTAANPTEDRDRTLFERLGLRAAGLPECGAGADCKERGVGHAPHSVAPGIPGPEGCH
jgi:biotin synthase